jgi:hypothetical protein
LNAEKHIIEKIRKVSRSIGYSFYSPEAKSFYYYLKPKKIDLKCWDHLNIDRVVRDILKNYSSDEEVVVIGFSNGGYLLGDALQRG